MPATEYEDFLDSLGDIDDALFDADDRDVYFEPSEECPQSSGPIEDYID